MRSQDIPVSADTSKTPGTRPETPGHKAVRPQIKICGLTNLSDAQAATAAGADYLGFVFIERSKRHVTASDLTPWWGELDGKAKRVALFQDAPSSFVAAVLNQIDVDVLQFHGRETETFCAQFSKPYWKSVGLPVGGSAVGESFTTVSQRFASASAWVVDSVTVDDAGEKISGGTGKQFDWALWPRWSLEKLILAGGLDANNVVAAARALRPWAVDVSSGVESVPGRKDHEKIDQFCKALTDEYS